MRRRLLVLTVIVVAVTVVRLLYLYFWMNEGPLWRLVIVKETVLVVKYESLGPHEIRVHLFENRWTGKPLQRLQVGYYVENGFKALEVIPDVGRDTAWNYDGTVKFQKRPGVLKDSPPWWFGVTDQTEPTALWWNKKQ